MFSSCNAFKKNSEPPTRIHREDYSLGQNGNNNDHGSIDARPKKERLVPPLLLPLLEYHLLELYYSKNNISQCEEGSSNSDTKRQEIQRIRRPSDDNPYKEEIERMQRELEEPCKACMYTGVAVCGGLSLYFVKLATDDMTLPKHRRFLWICSAGSLVAGMYRWYLG